MSTKPLKIIGNLFGVVGLFLRLGATAFGGPMEHINSMEREVVVKRGWISRDEFFELLGNVNLIPGPNSTEMAMFIGYRRAGWLGFLLGGICFILPASIIVSGIAWVYINFGKMSQAEGLFYGIKPVIIAVLVQAIWNLGRAAVKTPLLGIVGAVAAALSCFAVNPFLILLGAGAFMLIFRAATQPGGAAFCLTPLFGESTEFRLLTTAGVASSFSLWPMFLFFFKVGFVMFGSGYVMLAFLRTDLVGHWHWLTEGQLLDAVAAGQFTPGPLLTTATFIGYVLGGPQAALLATVAIFLPSFVLVAISGPLMQRLRQSRLTRAFLDGVNVGLPALLAVVTWQLGRVALVDGLTISLAVASAVWLLFFRVNSTWLILAGAAIGLTRFVFQAGS
jgi:chromate transporter